MGLRADGPQIAFLFTSVYSLGGIWLTLYLFSAMCTFPVPLSTLLLFCPWLFELLRKDSYCRSALSSVLLSLTQFHYHSSMFSCHPSEQQAFRGKNKRRAEYFYLIISSTVRGLSTWSFFFHDHPVPSCWILNSRVVSSSCPKHFASVSPVPNTVSFFVVFLKCYSSIDSAELFYLAFVRVSWVFLSSYPYSKSLSLTSYQSLYFKDVPEQRCWALLFLLLLLFIMFSHWSRRAWITSQYVRSLKNYLSQEIPQSSFSFRVLGSVNSCSSSPLFV